MNYRRTHHLKTAPTSRPRGRNRPRPVNPTGAHAFFVAPCWCANSQVARAPPRQKRAQTGRPVRRSTGKAAATSANCLFRAPRLGQPSQNGGRAAPPRGRRPFAAAHQTARRAMAPLAPRRRRRAATATPARAGDGGAVNTRRLVEGERRDVGLANSRSARALVVHREELVVGLVGPLDGRHLAEVAVRRGTQRRSSTPPAAAAASEASVPRQFAHATNRSRRSAGHASGNAAKCFAVKSLARSNSRDTSPSDGAPRCRDTLLGRPRPNAT